MHAIFIYVYLIIMWLNRSIILHQFFFQYWFFQSPSVWFFCNFPEVFKISTWSWLRLLSSKMTQCSLVQVYRHFSTPKVESLECNKMWGHICRSTEQRHMPQDSTVHIHITTFLTRINLSTIWGFRWHVYKEFKIFGFLSNDVSKITLKGFKPVPY